MLVQKSEKIWVISKVFFIFEYFFQKINELALEVVADEQHKK